MTWFRTAAPPPPIGIGITTLNRRDMLKRTLKKMARYTPAGVPIVVVDDGSDHPYKLADYRNEFPKGVANAKNHCLRLLMAKPEVQHIFLFDDDCHPTERGWWQPYVESEEHHLAYLHNNLRPGVHEVVYDDGKVRATERGTGCMLYFDRKAIETIGGFREDFGRWGMEHDEITHRLRNAKLTRFPYQGLSKQRGIWNLDEHVHGRSCISPMERELIRLRNKITFEKYRWSDDYVPYADE